MSNLQSSVKQKTIAGISWVMLAQLITQTITFIIGVILARLLTPADFGLIGMATVFSGFALMISKAGFSQALVQRLQVDDTLYSSVLWLNIVIGTATTSLFMVISPFIAAFYGDSRLKLITIALSFIFLLRSTIIVQQTIFQREMQFRTVGLIRVRAAFISGFTAISMAYLGMGYWSLIALTLINEICVVLFMWLKSNWRPLLIFQFSTVKELLGYSLNFTGFTIVDYWSRNADNLLIGRYFGSALLGIYTRAYSLMLLPINQIFVVVNQVMFSTFASIQQNLAQVQRAYLKALSSFALISVPFMLGLFVLSEPFILTIYGSKWAAVIPILKYMCFIGLFRSLTITSKWIFQSQAKVGIMFKWEIVRTIFTLLAFAVGIYYKNLELLVQLFLLATILLFIPDMYIPLRIVKLSLAGLLKHIAPIALCSFLMSALVLVIDSFIIQNYPYWARLMIGSLVGILAYAASLYIFRIDIFLELSGIAGERLKEINAKLHTIKS